MYPRTRFDQIVSTSLLSLLAGTVVALIVGVATVLVGHVELMNSAAVIAGIAGATVQFVVDAAIWYDRT